MTQSRSSTDIQECKHEGEGIHFACQEMLDKLGDKTGCCGCNKHECKFTDIQKCENCMSDLYPGGYFLVDSVKHPKCTECGRDLSISPSVATEEGWEEKLELIFNNYKNGKGLIYSQFELKQALKSFIAQEMSKARADALDKAVEKVIERAKEKVLVDIGIGNDGSDYAKGWYKAMDFVEKGLVSLSSENRKETE